MSNYIENIEKSELVKRSHGLINEISMKFDIFREILDRSRQGKITEEQMRKEINDILSTKTEEELAELNEIGRMFSESNCDWRYYQVRQIVHEEYLKNVYGRSL